MRRLAILLLFALPLAADWRMVHTEGAPQARHEAAVVELDGKLYLLGGRGEKPMDMYDPATNVWTTAAQPPIEIHHFQPIVFESKIWVLGALTGKYPHETPVPHALLYDPAADAWSQGPAIPMNRRRGAAGVSVYNGKIYLTGGIVDGHWEGTQPWLDELEPVSGRWRQLPDMPHARDHFQTVVLDGKLYAAAGRRSSAKTKETFTLTIAKVDVFDFETGDWSSLAQDLPTQRAGNFAVAYHGRMLVLGGESPQKLAHSQVEAYDPSAGAWETWSPLTIGRHGTGVAVLDGKLWVAAGSANRGGGPELNSLEVYEP